MFGNMMIKPLLISNLIEHASLYHGDRKIFSKNLDDSMVETSWFEISENSKKYANVLKSLKMEKGDRIATIAWNNHRHIEAWYAISGSGMVCHTINPRLFPDQLIFIINDANDKILMFDKTFAALIAKIKPHIKNVDFFICMDSFDPEIKEILPQVKFYDDLIRTQSSVFEWPQFDENTASSLCYTSGTTGNPKGVLYSHRSTLLHCFAASLPDSINLSSQEIVLPVVPMFHVNAWGVPYAAAMVGCSLVLPGSRLDGISLIELIDKYEITLALGVPTIWQTLLTHARTSNTKLKSLKRTIVGGAACPSTIIKEFKERYDCETIHAWGMTETSPLGTINQLKAKHGKLNENEKTKLRLSQGRPPFGVSIRITNEENATQTLLNDGSNIGYLQIQGHWVVEKYFKTESRLLTSDGWFDTGDMASIDNDGYLNLSDRAKDLIKSGGEWISSSLLENIALENAGVALVAAIAAKHPKWDERPILIVKKSSENSITEEQLLDFFQDKVAKWQIPDKVIFLDSIPIGGTGKIVKKDLREKYGNVLLNDF
ncbi:long-chain fatty acid--CoA ligase [Acinetobacter venetianus]|uniref:long-chain fatty acid--CoA ligase n=1 Tax=Acinetobacter venetianus TaxID=52133 RepID=UPI001A146157|nr:long-chain fatty acid--CoA ligase [Acinetobacter venetianus]HIQ35566.1 long-chain-fatty-acid--CoA ligase [Acinetobacter venetianus]HJP46366.1 long-chain fatty acid--CoA ligase [Acinetobacter venetianus]